MDDWWIWSSSDLVNWTHETTLNPEETFLKDPEFRSCWATDTVERNGKYYWYFSARGETGVMVGDSPVGPWRDPLGKPLLTIGMIPDRQTPEGPKPVRLYDPGVLVDDDGEAYIVAGVWEYYIARLNEDMISLAEEPRKLVINQPEGPYGIGKTDDKPYIHKRNGIYYLSWGSYYGMSDNVYGPYDCKGSFLKAENVDPEFRTHYKDDERGITFDRHGSFFEWRGQWYFICNDMSQTGNRFYRDSVIAYVNYRPNGEIEPIHITKQGVTLPLQTR